MPTFQYLLDGVPGLLQRPAADAAVTAPISEDSRTVEPGGVFVAREGMHVDSHSFIESAVARGAVAVVGERPLDQVTSSVPYAQVQDAQGAIGWLAAAYFGFPSRNLVVIGVTGTDGKTTTTNLIFNILKAAGKRVGMISTVSAVIGDEEMPTGLHVTTPTAPETQEYLHRMVNAGLTHCVLETTSHGLAQGRVNAVDFDVAVLTNLTHEHLDFHGSFESYRAAKGLLFRNLGGSFRKPGVKKVAVVNYDDPNADYFLGIHADEHLVFTTNWIPDLYGARTDGNRIEYTPTATRFTIAFMALAFPVETPLVGRFNVENVLAAATAAFALGDIAPGSIQSGIATLPLIPGRMERIDEGQNFLAIVDFAHTPNALRRALEAARPMTKGRVISVFGSAGLRDREKRRLMAEVSAELADISVFTAEDPRTESLDAILQVMADAAVSKGGVEGKTFYRVPDRGAAIAFACSLAQAGDVVIACGKGHEQSMAFGTVEYPWDDREAMRAAVRGSPLKTLPTAQSRTKP
jgi:UDP-N-acetylmuramoyl-L-alanyl-D-glutamate--2,6-diaminopimelate ligase